MVSARRSQRKRKKMPALDRYVVFSLTALVVFTITAIVYQFVAGQELSSTLISCFFAAFGGELLMLCMIKRLKLKKGDTDEMAD